VIRNRLDRHVKPELCDLPGRDLRGEHRQLEVARVEDGLRIAQVATRELARASKVSRRWVDPRLAESRHAVRQVLIRDLCHQRPAARLEQFLPVQCEVDRAPQLRVVPEERPRRVEREHADPEPGSHEEPRLVDPVLPDEVERRIEEDARDHVPPVDLVAVDASEELCRRAASEIDVEPGQVNVARAVVVRVSSDHDAFVLAVFLDVEGAGRRKRTAALARRRKPRWDRAEVGKGRSSGEVRRRPREPHGEREAARDDAASRPSSSGGHVRCSDDVSHEDAAGRGRAELEHAVDRVGERVCLQLLSVAESKAGAQPERVRLEVLRDLPTGHHFGL
jgi:hypothetical protein